MLILFIKISIKSDANCHPRKTKSNRKGNIISQHDHIYIVAY